MNEIMLFMIDKLKGMRDISLQRVRLSFNGEGAEPLAYFNFKMRRKEYFLEVINSKSKPIFIAPEDAYYLHYTEQSLLFFHVAASHLAVYAREYQLDAFTCLRKDLFSYQKDLAAIHSTLVANN
jgi:hypothetical protein